MKKIKILLFFIFFNSFAFSSENFIQEDLKVALSRFKGKKVYFKAERGSLFVEIGEGEKRSVVEIPEGAVEEVVLKNGEIGFGKFYNRILKVYQGDYNARLSLSSDGVKFSPYRGELEFILYDGVVLPLNSVQSEDYLYSVVPSEIGAYFSEEAIKAQIVAARTYLYYNLKNRKYKDFDLMDNVSSQMYLGSARENSKINTLVDSVRGEIIVFQDEPINALYHSTSGGVTANNEDIWGGRPVPYLRSVDDRGNEEKSPRKNWDTTISKKELSQKAGFRVNKIKVVSVTSDGNRIKTLELIGDAQRKLVGGDKFRSLVGYSKIFSTQFKIRDKGDYFLFNGKGAGHGVGMSQYGANGLAEKGKKYREILRHYYNGVEIKTLKNDWNML